MPEALRISFSPFIYGVVLYRRMHVYVCEIVALHTNRNIYSYLFIYLCIHSVGQVFVNIWLELFIPTFLRDSRARINERCAYVPKRKERKCD